MIIGYVSGLFVGGVIFGILAVILIVKPAGLLGWKQIVRL